jgi:hypothetical protein
MVKLADTQRIVLTTAGGRERALVLPLAKSLKLTATKAQPIIAGLIKSGLIAEVTLTDGDPLWRTDEALGKLTLVATLSGLKAVGIEPAASPPGENEPATSKTKTRTSTPASSAPKKSPRQSTPILPAATTKLGILVAALKGKKGATLADLTQATGWQPHSVRGTISGALKRKLGLTIDSSVVEGRGRVYRIAE